MSKQKFVTVIFLSSIDRKEIILFNVLGIGNAIVDILALVDDNFLEEHNLHKSNMQLTSTEKQNKILFDLKNLTEASGGSVANTIATLAGLSSNAAFIGQVSDDKWGKFFEQDMNEMGVTTDLNVITSHGKSASGTSIILITPDGERTMNTNLGVSSQIDIACVNVDLIAKSKIVYIEGYLYDSPETMEAIELIVSIAKANGSKIALSLSDSFCVDRHREDFKKLFKNIDILFANEAEFCSLFEIENQALSGDTILQYAEKLPALVAITQSERGCSILDDGNIISVATQAIAYPQDLTGAGDQFAAGFLHVVSGEGTSKEAGEFGIKLASSIISKIGPRFTQEELNNLS